MAGFDLPQKTGLSLDFHDTFPANWCVADRYKSINSKGYQGQSLSAVDHLLVRYLAISGDITVLYGERDLEERFCDSRDGASTAWP
jgi:hypothetical protein